MNEPLYVVNTYMTEKEYLARKATPDPHNMLNHVRLQEVTRYTQQLFGEEDIPNIIYGAADLLEMNVDRFGPDEYDVTGWPFELKVAVMSYAKLYWIPAMYDGVASEWDKNRKQEAREMFEKLPEIRLALDRTPEEVARAWLERSQEPEDEGNSETPTRATAP